MKILVSFLVGVISLSLGRGHVWASSEHGIGHDDHSNYAETFVCNEWQPVNTQFRLSSEGGHWTHGSDMEVTVGEVIDVNCFAKNGGALLPGAKIVIRHNEGKEVHVGAELRNYRLDYKGKYTFTCQREDAAMACSDSDGFWVQARPAPSPHPTMLPVPSPSLKPTEPPVIKKVIHKFITIKAQEEEKAICEIEVAETDGEIVKWQVRGDDAVEYITYIEETGEQVTGNREGDGYAFAQALLAGVYTLEAYESHRGKQADACDKVRVTVEEERRGGQVKGATTEKLEQPKTGATSSVLALMGGTGLGSAALWWWRERL